MSLYRNFLSVGGLTLLSRIAGFVRDALMAAVLGTGMAADAFLAAFRFPNLFRRLFAEGAFNTAFVPMFAGALEQHGPDSARELASRIMAWLVTVILVVTILAEIFMPVVLAPFVPGFADDPEKYELTVLLTRIMFPYLACMSLMAAYGAILNSLGKFFAAAFAPVLLNLVSVAAMIPLVIWTVETGAEAAIWVAIATMAGGIAQLALVWRAISKAGFRPAFRLPTLSPEIRRFWVLAVPAILTGGITQINIFVGTIIASGAESAISYLYYADRLYQLPLGIIGIAIGTVLLPELARHIKGGRDNEARGVQDQSLLIAMLLSMPAATALAALAEPIVRVLFERGAFDAVATVETARALIAFSLGLPAFVLVRVLQPGFFARQDTVTPTIFAAISAAVNVGLAFALFAQFAHVGIALATTISAWVNTILLATFLARRGHFALDRAGWLRHSGIVVIAVGMALLLAGLSVLLGPVFSPGASFLIQLLALGGLVLSGMAIYFAAIHGFGIQPLGMLLRRLRRGG
ncbi:murein biosynthesis integral membrane protein MurJ [Arsenicitalea aurantiaca]|uniref:Probable lipid II flippase MurJ n=1 Tax=Arsenicitalea aurantiaca TaxID=1783274 RepID=A0A433X807_9HYPH|nr:murein biosynthesis integral membrane protein MurJ [Arsenicitalea aurantiaca]RUT30192.1 murein biosynthesis integral membrane protein MurJ [Arsenicitalea aurantiaca]